MLIINNTLEGYLQNVEIKGNSYQDPTNLADILSVGDKLENQELYEIPLLCCGKNLFNKSKVINGKVQSSSGIINSTSDWNVSEFIKHNNKSFIISGIPNSKVSGVSIYIGLYDKDKNFLKFIAKPVASCIVNDSELSNSVYFVFSIHNTDLLTCQIEEGTVVTSFENYKSHELTILSPCQIEKVGDKADRIIEKDGVWGVEKNIVEKIVVESTALSANTTSLNTVKFECNRATFLPNSTTILTSGKCITNQLNFGLIYSEDNEGFYADTLCVFRLNKTKFKSLDKIGYDEYFKNNPLIFKYQTTTPQFIPLPHDQQIILRTFANKTNISFLTANGIEGTIKGTVPKSLGATVSTHTEQIDNLTKDLERVKKLEDATTSTVITESSFATVEETSNGYFSDVKLEGKTLVNKFVKGTFSDTGSTLLQVNNSKSQLLGDYTLHISNMSKKVVVDIHKISDDSWVRAISNMNGTVPANKLIVNLSSDEYVKNVYGKYSDGWTSADANNFKNVLLLEGDHTQNPPSYFEGLKSVGEGVDEITISSVNASGNLFDIESFKTNLVIARGNVSFEGDTITITSTSADCHTGGVITSGQLPLDQRVRCVSIPSNTRIDISMDNTTAQANIYACILDSNYNFIENKIFYISSTTNTYSFTSNSNARYMIIRLGVPTTNTTIKFSNILVKTNSNTNSSTKHQSDKKQLLFFDTVDSTWKKPILRQWDSIEKHSDGKYYYHQRSGQVVLNGTESWANYPTSIVTSAKLVNSSIGSSLGICDKLKIKLQANEEIEGLFIHSTNKELYISLDKTKANDLAGLKTWLSTNNVTVVYQLAQEKIYECTPLDLISYDNETNYIINAGAISPKSTVRVQNFIGNVINTLKEKVSLLEDKTMNLFKLVLAGSVQTLAYELYPQDFEEVNNNEMATLEEPIM